MLYKHEGHWCHLDGKCGVGDLMQAECLRAKKKAYWRRRMYDNREKKTPMQLEMEFVARTRLPEAPLVVPRLYYKHSRNYIYHSDLICLEVMFQEGRQDSKTGYTWEASVDDLTARAPEIIKH